MLRNSTLDEFRKTARDYLSTEDRFVIVNYLRKAIGQEKGGHISPLAAYDAETDRFLILDVSRYKYPPGLGDSFPALRRDEHPGFRQREQDARVRPGCEG